MYPPANWWLPRLIPRKVSLRDSGGPILENSLPIDWDLRNPRPYCPGNVWICAWPLVNIVARKKINMLILNILCTGILKKHMSYYSITALQNKCTSTKVIKYAEPRTLGWTTKICFIMNYVHLIWFWLVVYFFKIYH